MNLLSVILMSSPGGAQSPVGSLVFLGLIFVVFYFFMIRPQIKKTKQQNKFRQEIKKGDKIITIGGVHGKIIEISDTICIIEVEGANRLKIEKSAISMESTQMLTEKK